MTPSIPPKFQAYAFPENHDGIQSLRLIQLDTPEPGPGEVLVKIKAVSLNFRDVMVAENVYPGPYATTSDRKGIIPTSDAAGEIVRLGPGTESSWKLGDRVHNIFARDWLAGPFKPDFPKSGFGAVIHGTLTQYFLTRSSALLSIPEGLSFEEASTIACAGVTAFNALFEGPSPLAPDQTVLIQGTGGVSIWAAQIAVAAGARVIATSSSPRKMELLKKIGVDADDLINYKEYPKWSEEVNRLTVGDGVDHVLEIGGPGTLIQSLRSASANGQIHIIGVRAGVPDAEEASELSTFALTAIHKSITFRGLYVGSRDMNERLNKIITRHKIRPVIDKVFSWSEAVSAFEYVKGGSQFGKVVIRVED